VIHDFDFSVPGAEIFVPDGSEWPKALSRTTHLGVGAHQDDLEFMAYAGILECYRKRELWFTGVTTTDGGGSARSGSFASYTDEEMMALRREEQRQAAKIGEYGAQFQLNHPSKAVKDPKNGFVIGDFVRILEACRPETVYTHNLADKHDTHVGVALKLIAAIRRLPKEQRPKALYGCEVWRDLDWLKDSDKILMPVDENEALANDLMAVYQSQIAGGKRYDEAIRGRRKAHATFIESHAVDQRKALIFGMDLSPLLLDDSLSPEALYKTYLKNFETEVIERLNKISGT
jgi:LmbE family N-acetylglucosaminyl deacetylase